MEVIVAKTAGFCFGVKRAVEQVYEQIEKAEKPVYTYGPIIHNEFVVKDLEEKGVRVLNTEEELAALKDGIVVIRSHGVGKHIYDLLEDHHITVVDATCPFVKKIHRIVEKQTAEGRRVIIIGSPEHPEVQGIRGWGDDTTLVVEKPEQIDDLPVRKDEKLCIVSQTTFNYKKFQDLVEIIRKKEYNVCISNTICNATEERQNEAERIASRADAMIVIGDSSSSNTRKLYEICRTQCQETFYIQTLSGLELDKLESSDCIGITAGASTPNNIIEEVYTNVRRKLCTDVR